MRLNELKVGMTKDIAPVTVDEEEMLSFSSLRPSYEKSAFH